MTKSAPPPASSSHADVVLNRDQAEAGHLVSDTHDQIRATAGIEQPVEEVGLDRPVDADLAEGSA